VSYSRIPFLLFKCYLWGVDLVQVELRAAEFYLSYIWSSWEQNVHSSQPMNVDKAGFVSICCLSRTDQCSWDSEEGYSGLFWWSHFSINSLLEILFSGAPGKFLTGKARLETRDNGCLTLKATATNKKWSLKPGLRRDLRAFLHLCKVSKNLNL
jgi:hypothetical protein